MRYPLAFLLLFLLSPYAQALETGPVQDLALGDLLDGNTKVDADWQARWAWQGGGDSVHLLVNVEDDFDLGAWADAHGHPSYRIAREVSGYLLLLPLTEVPRLADHPGVTFIEFDHAMEYHLATSSTTAQARGPSGFGGMWQAGPDGWTAPHDLERPFTGAGVTVAVLDTGLDETHPDFGGYGCETGPGETACESRVTAKVQIEEIPYFLDLGAGGIVPYIGIGDAMPNTDTDGHGTHTAGTIAGNGRMSREHGNPQDGGDGHSIGIAPEANIVSVAIGVGPHAGLNSAAQGWVLDHAEEYGITITSNSYGCSGGCEYNPDALIVETIQAFYESGIVSAFSNGNSGGQGSGAEMGSSAQIPWALGVAAYNDVDGQLASFSSRGLETETLVDPRTWTPESEGDEPPRRPDVAAPGVSIQAPLATFAGTSGGRVPGGTGTETTSYVGLSGTSMSAPHVAGALALLSEACPSATPLDLMRAIMIGADPTGTIKTKDVPDDLPGTPVTGGPWSYGNGPTEPFETGYGALRIRGGLDYLFDEVCPDDDVRKATEQQVTPIVTEQFSSTTFSVPKGTGTVRGLPAGMTWDREAGNIHGTPHHAGLWALELEGPAGSTWTPLLVIESQIPNEVDVREGIQGTLDVFGLTSSAIASPLGAAFLRAPATVEAALALCSTDCSPPGAGIPVGFVRGTAPDGSPASQRLQQSLPGEPDIESIRLGPGIVRFSIEAGAFAGGARMWIPTSGEWGYEATPRLDLPFEARAKTGAAFTMELPWEGNEGAVELIDGPDGMTLSGTTLTWRPREETDRGVWFNVTDGTQVQQQGFRIIVSTNPGPATTVIGPPPAESEAAVGDLDAPPPNRILAPGATLVIAVLAMALYLRRR